MTFTNPSISQNGIEQWPNLAHGREDITELVLIRHGRTAANRAGLLQGWMDVPLDEFGLRQADAVSRRVASDVPPDLIVCSTLSRARATAAPLARIMGIEPIYDPDLQEMNFGDYEGRSWAEIERTDPHLVARLGNFSDESVAWPNGESRAEFHGRVWTAMERIVHTRHGQRVAVVSHGGVIGAFMAMLRGLTPGDPSIYGLRNCSITHLHVRETHTEVHRYNDIGHLEGLEEIGPTGEIDL